MYNIYLYLHIPNKILPLKTLQMIERRCLHKHHCFWKGKFKEKTAIKWEEIRWPQSETVNHSLVISDFYDKGLQNYLPFFSFSAYLEGINMLTSLPMFLCFCCKSDLLICLVITGIILFYMEVVAYFPYRRLLTGHSVMLSQPQKIAALTSVSLQVALAVGGNAHVIPSCARF